MIHHNHMIDLEEMQRTHDKMALRAYMFPRIACGLHMALFAVCMVLAFTLRHTDRCRGMLIIGGVCFAMGLFWFVLRGEDKRKR